MRKLNTFLRAVPALLLLGAAGCDDGLTEINRNPNSPENVPVEFLLAAGIWDAVDSNAGVGGFGPWTMLYHTELWAQHIAQAGYNDEDRYTPRTGIPTAIWDNFYAGSLADLQRVKEIATEEEDNNLWAVAEIMSVYNFLLLTDLFGDVPYTEALSLGEGVQNPKYDTQASIYQDLIVRLRAAVTRIDAGADVDFEDGDLIYEGDMDGWARFANSLQLRVAIRMAGTSLNAAGAQAFAQAWGTGRLITSVSQQADLDWTGEQPSQNPIYEQIILGGRPGDFRVSKTLVDSLTQLGDPRLEVYANPTLTDDTYRGLPNGLTPAQVGGTHNTSGAYSTIGDYFLQPDAPSVLMSAAEVYLLAAEAAARGWIAADPAQLYRQGITASFEQYGLAAEAPAYLAQASVAYNGLQSIWLQKWIALYMAGTEAFTEVRRTGTPNLTPSANALLATIPARLPYPTEEGLYNPDNYPTGVEIDTPVWFMNH
ncbi:MAG TPA: SusD/RagB family nutrient-binding outer membrane lipoprotein [Longimicrobium sp.]